MTPMITAGSKLSLQAKFARLANKSKPSKRAQIRRAFHDLFQQIEQCIADGRTLTEARELFNEIAKANLCARTFVHLLKVERERIKEAFETSTSVASALVTDTRGQE